MHDGPGEHESPGPFCCGALVAVAVAGLALREHVAVTAGNGARADGCEAERAYAYSSIGGHAHTRLRSPNALSIRATCGQNFRSRVECVG
jgi:hypothetical protein